MKIHILSSFLIVSCFSFTQLDNRSKIKAELTEWDPVRGEWLAESFQAMANKQPIPDRTFPEDLTPAEMFSLVPAERQNRIREISKQEDTNPRNTQSTTTGTTTGNRIPVGNPSESTQTNNERSRNDYNYYLTRSNCKLIMGRSYGDPHIRTFDGSTYSFQTVGEYVLSSSPNSTFEVQARQKPQTDKVSLNTAVAMNVHGDRVGIYASDSPDNGSNTPLRVNGRTIFLSNETFYLPNGGTIQNNGKQYIVTWPTGEKVEAKLSSTGGMKFMNLSVYVYECDGNYIGLMGNANGRSDDDFTGTNNRGNLASSTIFTPFDSRDFNRTTLAIEREQLAFLARDFGGQFLVNDQNSLFEYNFGQSSWSFYDPSFPRTHLTLGDISQADRDRARRECERQGIFADEMAGCVMDFAHANIQPSPRPTVPNRTNGRELTTISNRTPNVNRTDVFERRPTTEGNGTRTPIETEGNDSRTTNRTDGTTTNPRSSNPTNPSTNTGTRENRTNNSEIQNSTNERIATPNEGSGNRKPDVNRNEVEIKEKPVDQNINTNGGTRTPIESRDRKVVTPATKSENVERKPVENKQSSTGNTTPSSSENNKSNNRSSTSTTTTPSRSTSPSSTQSSGSGSNQRTSSPASGSSNRSTPGNQRATGGGR